MLNYTHVINFAKLTKSSKEVEAVKFYTYGMDFSKTAAAITRKLCMRKEADNWRAGSLAETGTPDPVYGRV